MTETWSDKRMENWAGAARRIAALASEVRFEQGEFLALLGMTMEQARALPQAGRDALNYAWQAGGSGHAIHYWTGRGTLCSLDNAVEQKPTHSVRHNEVTCRYCLYQIQLKDKALDEIIGEVSR